MSNKKIEIKKPVIKDNNTVVWPIVINGINDEIHTTVSSNVAKYLSIDRIDPIVTGLLIFAVRNGYDFISDLPITDELLYGLNYHLIPAISAEAHTPLIKAPVIKPFENKGDIVATGISCGVDSLYTVATHTNLPNAAGNITHLAFFDAGSHRPEKGLSKTKEGRREMARKFACDNNFEYIEITSSIPEFIFYHSGNYSHVENHMYTMLHCVLSIAQGVKYYYYSAGLTYREFNCSYTPAKDYDAAYYDLLTLMAASFGPIKFFAAGGEATRLEKLRLLADYTPAHNSLNVCVNTVKNDNVCFKCARTLLELDALGKLDSFRNVFDIDYYRQHRSHYLETAYIGALRGNKFFIELMPYFKDQMTLSFKIKAIAKKAISVIKNRIR